MDRGTAAVIDAIIFFVILLIASTVLYIGSANYLTQTTEQKSRKYTTAIIEDVHNSVLGSSINGNGKVSYIDNGAVQTLSDFSVLDAIKKYVEFKALHYGLDEMEKGIKRGYELGVLEGYHYAVFIKVGERLELFFSDILEDEDAPLPSERFSSVKEVGTGINITIVLYIWKA